MKKFLVALALASPLLDSAASTLVCRMHVTGVEYVVRFADGDRDVYLNSERFHQWSRLDGEWANRRMVGKREYFNDVMAVNESLIHFGRVVIDFNVGITPAVLFGVSISRSTGTITITGEDAGAQAGVGSCEVGSDKKKF